MDWNNLGMLLDRHGFPMAVALILLYHVLIVERAQTKAFEKLIGRIDALIELQHAALSAAHTLAAILSRGSRAGRPGA